MLTNPRGIFKVLGSRSDWKIIDFTVPSCNCKDWCTFHLPCKHFFAVFRVHPEFDWDRLPETYRQQPRLCLDFSRLSLPEASSSCDVTPVEESLSPDNTDPESKADSLQAQPASIPRHKVSCTKGSNCHHVVM